MIWRPQNIWRSISSQMVEWCFLGEAESCCGEPQSWPHEDCLLLKRTVPVWIFLTNAVEHPPKLEKWWNEQVLPPPPQKSTFLIVSDKWMPFKWAESRRAEANIVMGTKPFPNQMLKIETLFDNWIFKKKRKSYFEKRLLLREEHFIRRRDFYEEKKVLLGKEFYYERLSYFEKRLLRGEESLMKKRVLLWKDCPILKRDFYEEKNVLLWKRLLLGEENLVRKRDFY